MTAPLRLFGHSSDAGLSDRVLDLLESGRAHISLDGGRTWAPTGRLVPTGGTAAVRAADLPIQSADPAGPAPRPAPRTLTARIAGRTVTYRVLPAPQEA